MGERKGTNKYYPPDYDPSKGSLNAFHGTHALRERARKIHLGILIIRFEMPYNIWCNGCGNHIARGVRYNAEKTKVGKYYTTTIYQFRMKCHLCETHFEIRTDPKNFDYEIISGCSRQERRWEPEADEMVELSGKEEAKKMATDAMFRLEHGTDDGLKKRGVEPVINNLQRFQDRMKDDFGANQALRAAFRTRKKEIAAVKVADEAVKKRANLDIDLVEETAEDRRLATLISQHSTRNSLRNSPIARRREVETQSIFGSSTDGKNLIIERLHRHQILKRLQKSTPILAKRKGAKTCKNLPKFGTFSPLSAGLDEKSNPPPSPINDTSPGTSTSSEATPMSGLAMCGMYSSSDSD